MDDDTCLPSMENDDVKTKQSHCLPSDNRHGD